MSDSTEKVTVHVERFNPATDTSLHWDTFEVPYEQRHSVLTLLNYIYEHYDRSLGYRNYICGRGICNSCQVSVDGKVRKGCATPIKAGEEIRLSPCSKYVIKDLATVLIGGPAEPAVLAEWREESERAGASGSDASTLARTAD